MGRTISNWPVSSRRKRGAMAVEKRQFGYTAAQEEVTCYVLTNKNGNSVSVLNYGCILQSVQVKDKDGHPVDVVLGFESVEGYDSAGGFIGAVVGRVANRITGGSFARNGRVWPLSQNDGKNHLHGGVEGFSKKVWDARTGNQEIWLWYVSRDGEEGYPGTLSVTVHYVWTDEDALVMEFSYAADQDTPVSLTNHAYFNLNGAGAEDGSSAAMEQELTVQAGFYTPVDEKGLVTGEIHKVDGTPFDFRSPKVLACACDDLDPQIAAVGGFDHNLVLNGRDQILLRGLSSGVSMAMDTDSPGVQLYSGNYLRERTGKDGRKYRKCSGICLEPQYFPNSVNISHFLSPYIEKGQWKTVRTIYHFYTENGETMNNQEGSKDE